MTSIQIFNVCTHSRDGGGGFSLGIPTPCVISPHPTNPQRFVTGGGDSNAFIWHFTNNSECGLELQAKLTYHTKQVNSVIWNSIGDELVTSGDDKMITIWKQDLKYNYLSAKNNEPSFGESMIFKEKWLPKIKLRGPLAEVSDIKYINNNKDIIVSSLDGSIGFYNIKKQQHLHTISLNKNTQFIQGLSVDYTCNLLAIQTNSASAKVYKINKRKKDKKDKKIKQKRKYTTELFCSLSYYPYSIQEIQQQKLFNQQYEDEMKELEKIKSETPPTNANDNANANINANINANANTNANANSNANVNANANSNANVNANANANANANTNANANATLTNANTNENTNNAEITVIEKPKIKVKNKVKKNKVTKCALFKHNLPTTSRQPHWSCDGLLLAMVAGQSKDKLNNCIHIFHRANLNKKITTILLPESSNATSVRFNPLKLKLDTEIGIDKGSIVDKYNMKYKMLFSVICGAELFIFDTSKNNAVLYWKDEDTQTFHDMEWSFNGKILLISDVEGFITRISLSDDDIQTI